jgi:cellulose synthase/poly-beta-1,6-N-acetylglucosamine synthase-like glycosyltransferase
MKTKFWKSKRMEFKNFGQYIIKEREVHRTIQIRTRRQSMVLCLICFYFSRISISTSTSTLLLLLLFGWLWLWGLLLLLLLILILLLLITIVIVPRETIFLGRENHQKTPTKNIHCILMLTEIKRLPISAYCYLPEKN